MPVTVAGLRQIPVDRSITVVSPLIELGSALHVLHEPAHHGADAWAAEIRRSIGPGLLRRTTAWAWTSQAIRAAPFLLITTDDFEACLDHLRALPPYRLAGQLLRPISRTGEVAPARRWSRSRPPEVVACVDALIDRPAEAVADFLGFLEESWEQWFQAEWGRGAPALRDSARRFTDYWRRTGSVAEALATLDPSITGTPSGDAVTIAKVQSARHDVSRRGLAIAPSEFIRPHLYVGNVTGQPLLLITPARPAASATSVPTAADLASRLLSVAHRGRMEVARAIATEPRTAGEISVLWNMDPTLVNRHLRALESTGLARATRRGKFVQYELDHEAVEALGRELLGLLLR